MPQLSQTMAPPGATIWWSGPGSAPAQARPGPVPYGPSAPPGRHGSAPPGRCLPAPAGVPARAPVPPAPASPGPGSPTPGPSASCRPRKPRPGPVAGGIALGLGILLLLIGAAGHVAIIVIGGLVAAAWGMWRLVTGTGKPSRPARRDVAYVTTHCSCFQYASRSPSFVPTMTAMTRCWLSLVTMMG